MPSRRLRRALAAGAALAVVVGVSAVIGARDGDRPASGPSDCPAPPAGATAAGAAPTIPGLTWVALPAAERPPAPVGRATATSTSDEPGSPSNQWWSAALAAPGSQPLWARPLAVMVGDDGSVAVSNQAPARSGDGMTATAFVPALSTPPDPGAAPTVSGWGAFHVSLTVTAPGSGAAPAEGSAASRGSLAVDVVAGSPLVELTFVDRAVELVAGPAAADPVVSPVDERSAVVEGGGRAWVLTADRSTTWIVAGDVVSARPATEPAAGEPVRVVVGPLPANESAGAADPVGASTVDPAGWAARARDVADHPLLDTTEALSVGTTGSVEQVLTVDRQDGAPSVWALGPHQVGSLDGEPFGWVPDPRGPAPLTSGTSLTVAYDPVPVLWGAVALGEGADRELESLLAADLAAGPSASGGSYFGGKRVAYAAALADLAVAHGLDGVAAEALDEVRRTLDDLVAGAGPGLAWDERWGTVVVTPAEFGAGDQLNDHHLQYGYWVAAASQLALADPAWAAEHEAVVDLLVADYGGADLVPCAPEGVAGTRTWDAQAGHSWASGLAPFADGNNLESTGEAIHAWWAAARWFLATGRPELAEPFVARLTIEARVSGRLWFPERGSSGDRPWFGIVWSAKTDLGTWFDPAPESALGIQLLPLGPVSLSRYPDAAALTAAGARWDWCDAEAGGCGARWTNLLAADARVAGRDLPAGPDPEPSVSASMLEWWRQLWLVWPEPDTTTACGPGAVVRRDGDGVGVVLAVNPGPETLHMRCGGADLELGPGARLVVEITP